MKKRTLLYVPLMILFVISMTALIQHGSRTFMMLNRTVNQNSSIRIPFELERTKVAGVLPEASEAGIRIGDNLTEINGRPLTDGTMLFEELGKMPVGEKVNYTIERTTETGETVRREIGVTGMPMEQTFRQWFPDFLTTFFFLLLLPVISFLLGFYVAFLRPRDPLAWVLLFLLLCIGSIALEADTPGTLPKFFQSVSMEFIGVWLLLFGIYFPERLDFDRRYPFAKWILIIPIALDGTANFFEQIGRTFGWRGLWEPIDNFTAPFDTVFTILTMLSFTVFFASLATKSGTVENKDSRRRLRILYVGTCVALLPSLFIVIYRLISGKNGGFFQLVPAWFAILCDLDDAVVSADDGVCHRRSNARWMSASSFGRDCNTRWRKTASRFCSSFALAIGLGVFWICRRIRRIFRPRRSILSPPVLRLIPLIDYARRKI